MSSKSSSEQGTSRRTFVKGTAVVGAGTMAGLSMPVWGSAPASGRLKVGLVGCGGRGTAFQYSSTSMMSIHSADDTSSWTHLV